MTLDQRDMEILLGLTEGLTTSELAERMHYELSSMSVFVSRMLKKMGARSRAQAVAIAYHEGILRPKVLA